MNYRVNETFNIECGFNVTAQMARHAADLTNAIIAALPASLFRSIDFKTTSAVIGSVFCEHLADVSGAIVNPIEKGHPDILPRSAANASEATLRSYPSGLEIKSTIGNIQTGANLRAGTRRVAQITGLTWQAHHQGVRKLMGLTWDFSQQHESFNFPGITGVFYSGDLRKADWGEISGTTGRNTKVTGMRSSGKNKMATGWVLLHDDTVYLEMFMRVFPVLGNILLE